MAGGDETLDALADALGIHPSHTDAFGRPTIVSPETKRAIAAAFGFPAATAGEAADSLARIRALRDDLLSPVVALAAARRGTVPLGGARAGDMVAWRLALEGGGEDGGESTAVAAPGGGAMLRLPPLPAGYHRLRAASGARRAEALVVAAPATCQPPAGAEERLWGVTAQLYGLRLQDDLGIGDYAAAGRLAAEAGATGAAFLGLSPVHALFGADRSKISPYSPSSRLFLETIHIDPRRIDGFAESGGAALLAGREAEIALLRDAPLASHAEVWAIKLPLLERLWRAFRARGGDPRFDRFRADAGEALQRHAIFEALSVHLWQRGHCWLGDWPDAYRRADSPEVRRFAAGNDDAIAFHAWLQWQADLQLGAAAAAARQAGMAIGLYRDLAVGCDRGGAEMWAAPERFAAALSIGAPPDPIAPQGQDWGLPPFDPIALEAQGLAAFRAVVAANMRHAGALRIDHAFQLRRLFLIPGGGPATAGAYVDYPLDQLLAVLRLESRRGGCAVIAEDLGNAPEGFSDRIMAAGLLSYRLLIFERGGDGAFRRPADYPRSALAAITTHDLPTFRGWWRGLDIDLRHSVGVYDQAMAAEQERARAGDKQALAAALFAEGLVPAPEPPEEPPFEAAARYLARSAAALAAIQIEDIAGELVQANLPGVGDPHPNWRRRLPVPLEAVTAPGGDLGKLAAALAGEGRGRRNGGSALAAPPPRATYRLQFHKGFTFDDAVAVVPYLARLGVSHLYASPILKARPGSTHGYDIVDHDAINPELGGEDGFVRLSEALKRHGLGLILDIVPNHMGVGGADNRAWLDVLEWGELAPQPIFDIDWQRLGADGKLVLPFLGARYGDALDAGQLALRFDPDEGSFSVWHFEHRFPISPLRYPIVLDRALAALGDADPAAAGEAMAISERLRVMAEEADPARRAGFPAEAAALKARLAAAAGASPPLAEAIGRAIGLINGTPGQPESFGTLHRILEGQSYRLAHWRVAASDINYRRFFDINGLAGLRMEDAALFETAHRLIFRLVAEGRVQGLRIDHVDGLADPAGYLRALQAAVGPGFYIVVEKILEPGEALRPWPVAGTTGYDALNLIDGLFAARPAEAAFDRLYRDLTGIREAYPALVRATKEEVLETSFASELEVLVSDLKRCADLDRHTRDLTATALRRALVEIVARLPVYRSYIDEAGPSDEDRRLIAETVRRAKRGSALPDRSVHDFIAAALIAEADADGTAPAEAATLIARFRRRFQQLTGPVMAKSVEDTLFYRFVRLLALNEVGGDPGRFGLAVDGFHAANAAREEHWPHAMIASATHDTKRGEDSRGRLLALSEFPQDWTAAVGQWEAAVAPHLGRGEEGPIPDADDRYLLLQSLVGAWPLALMGESPAPVAEWTGFAERMKAFATKALREAKRRTSWVNPDEGYEAAAASLIDAVLRPESEALAALLPLARRLAFAGALNGLVRTVLKCTVPGIPDVYQGTELWDFALVDPDNRRPVDFAARTAALGGAADWPAVLRDWRDGRVKARLLAALLAARAAAPALFAEGDYRPLATRGALGEHLVAFIRAHHGTRLAVVVPHLLAGRLGGDAWPLGAVWQDTTVALPAGTWTDALTGVAVEAAPGGVAAAALFAAFPAAVLMAD
ncbi:MAG TPA: malto-oligosyltrehalose synthase [Hyphomicrobiales bacterium]|nr:malto-oligosyltrehalose synthase [Hyphomicrobiales bacterium]